MGSLSQCRVLTTSTHERRTVTETHPATDPRTALAHLSVRDNAIQPGLIRSAMTEAMPQRIWDAQVAEVPMVRPASPQGGRRFTGPP